MDSIFFGVGGGISFWIGRTFVRQWTVNDKKYQAFLQSQQQEVDTFLKNQLNWSFNLKVSDGTFRLIKGDLECQQAEYQNSAGRPMPDQDWLMPFLKDNKFLIGNFVEKKRNVEFVPETYFKEITVNDQPTLVKMQEVRKVKEYLWKCSGNFWSLNLTIDKNQVQMRDFTKIGGSISIKHKFRGNQRFDWKQEAKYHALVNGIRAGTHVHALVLDKAVLIISPDKNEVLEQAKEIFGANGELLFMGRFFQFVAIPLVACAAYSFFNKDKKR